MLSIQVLVVGVILVGSINKLSKLCDLKRLNKLMVGLKLSKILTLKSPHTNKGLPDLVSLLKASSITSKNNFKLAEGGLYTHITMNCSNWTHANSIEHSTERDTISFRSLNLRFLFNIISDPPCIVLILQNELPTRLFLNLNMSWFTFNQCSVIHIILISSEFMNNSSSSCLPPVKQQMFWWTNLIDVTFFLLFLHGYCDDVQCAWLL